MVGEMLNVSKILIICFLFFFYTDAYSEEYSLYELSIFKADNLNSTISFISDNETVLLCKDKRSSVAMFSGEYKMYTRHDGACFFEYRGGSSLMWFYKDEEILLGWRALIAEKFYFDFFILLGKII